jgi:hypothetical protein
VALQVYALRKPLCQPALPTPHLKQRRRMVDTVCAPSHGQIHLYQTSKTRRLDISTAVSVHEHPDGCWPRWEPDIKAYASHAVAICSTADIQRPPATTHRGHGLGKRAMPYLPLSTSCSMDALVPRRSDRAHASPSTSDACRTTIEASRALGNSTRNCYTGPSAL